MMGAFRKKCAACGKVQVMSSFAPVAQGKRATICKDCQAKGIYTVAGGWWQPMPEILKSQYWSSKNESQMP